MTTRSALRGVTAFLLACLVLAAPAFGRPGDHELYYRLLMDKAPAGWMRVSQKTAGDRITSERQIHFSFRRGNAESSSEMSTTFVETTGGKPLSMRSMQKMGADPVVVEYTFTDKGVEAVTKQEGADVNKTLPAPTGDWLTPAAGAEFLAKRLKAGATSIAFRTIDPMTGPEVIKVTYSNVRAESAKVGDRTFEGFRMRSEASNAPGLVGEDFVDPQGLLVTQKATMGGMQIDLETAGPEIVKNTQAPPELMVSTFVRPDREIVDPSRASACTFVLDFGEGDAPTLPETGSQTVTSMQGAKVTISVDASFPHAAPKDDISNPAYLESSSMITAQDARVRLIAESAIKGIPAEDVLERARAIRKAVYRHITAKNLDVGFASAAEVARTRKGDCTEHAVLLTAALRAAGIPARVAGGLIYADEFAGAKGIFGYHMWSQALVTVDGSPRWVDLDATLHLEPGYDATHIALMAAPLSDAQGTQDMLAIAAAMGRVKISVVHVEHRR